MIFDDLGLPKDSGASDWADSARAAGVLSMFDKTFDAKKCLMYTKMLEDGTVVAMRHPVSTDNGANNWKNFTRDQLMCLAYGLLHADEKGTARKLYYAAKDRGFRAQNTEADVPGTTKKFPNGADFFTPSHRGHLRRCGGLESTWFQDLWLRMDILFHSKFTPLAEPCQLLAMCGSHSRDMIKFYLSSNKQWREGIRAYFSGWRGEAVLAELMIEVLEAI